MKAQRPLSVTWLALAALSLAAVFALRAYLTVLQWDFLQSLPLTLPPFYFLITGIVWSLAGLYIAVSLWRGSRFAPIATQIAAWALIGYYRLDRWLASPTLPAGSNQPFALGVAVTAILLIYWTLTRPQARAFFGEVHERKSEN